MVVSIPVQHIIPDGYVFVDYRKPVHGEKYQHLTDHRIFSYHSNDAITNVVIIKENK